MKTRVISCNNVNGAFQDAFWYMRVAGAAASSRNGDVIRAPGPVMTEYKRPNERLLFNPVRDANPVFHLMESIWMLAGHNYVEWLLQFNSTFDKYAEDDGAMHGAYGRRWRNGYGIDQILRAIDMLRKDPESRRVVIAMWSPSLDMGAEKRDLPCNTHLYFEIVNDKLNMTICCRSNDMFWGAYGANAVHMSVLQEVIAHGAGVKIGWMYQLSNNFHLYIDLPQVKQLLAEPPHTAHDYYEEGRCGYTPIFTEGDVGVPAFLRECENFVTSKVYIPRNPFLRDVALPLREIYLARKEGNVGWRRLLDDLQPTDWKLATQEWVQRRDA